MKKILVLSAVIMLSAISARAAELNVVTTTTDLASITEEVGGSRVSVTSLARGDQDHHYVEVRPSMVITVRDADLLVMIGMDHDVWVHALINSARNRNIRFSQPGYLDVSAGIEKLEVPVGRIDASMGHLHVYGNPHYWLDPVNAGIIAATIAGRLSELMPAEREYFERNLREFEDRIDEKMSEWQNRLRPFRGHQIAVFHRSWPYFARRFGLEVAAELEPRPGLPPSTAHLREVIETVRRNDIRVIISEVFNNRRPGRFVAERTDAVAVVLPTSVGAVRGADDYFRMMDILIDRLVEALER